jgi:aryl-alcohol dehydrogenase-like predicted oxidoreductase
MWRKDTAPTPTSAARPEARFDMTSAANQQKLEVVDALARVAEEAGISLVDLALGLVINHPGVTSAIIGPRTMDQLESQLPAADVKLSVEILDRIDGLVAPGVTLNPDDNSYGANELTAAARRR